MTKAWASPSGRGCASYAKRDAQRRPVAEQPLEGRLVVRRGDDQDLPDARQHQRAERVVDHRLVVDRHELLADGQGQRMQPGAGPAGEDDPFHAGTPQHVQRAAPAALLGGGEVRGDVAPAHVGLERLPDPGLPAVGDAGRGAAQDVPFRRDLEEQLRRVEVQARLRGDGPPRLPLHVVDRAARPERPPCAAARPAPASSCTRGADEVPAHEQAVGGKAVVERRAWSPRRSSRGTPSPPPPAAAG